MCAAGGRILGQSHLFEDQFAQNAIRIGQGLGHLKVVVALSDHKPTGLPESLTACLSNIEQHLNGSLNFHHTPLQVVLGIKVTVQRIGRDILYKTVNQARALSRSVREVFTIGKGFAFSD